MPLVDSYKDLLVWQKAFAWAVTIDKASQAWADAGRYGGVGDQLRRSSKSVVANIVEGFAKQNSRAEFGRFLSIALGSAIESLSWLDFVEALGYEDGTKVEQWRKDCEEIVRMLRAFRKKVKD